MSDILVLAPVLNRPQNAEPLVASFLAARTVPSYLLFVCSPGDDEQIAACFHAGTPRDWVPPEGWGPGDPRPAGAAGVLVADFPPGPGDFSRKINLAYRMTSQPFLFQAADDVRFERGWDTEALRVAAETGAHVVGTNDLGNPTVMRGDHSTHTLIRRSYIDDPGASLDGPGIAFSEAYSHQFCDTELVELAKARGVWAWAGRSVVEHLHPFWKGRHLMDETYRKGLATGDADRRLYRERSAEWK